MAVATLAVPQIHLPRDHFGHRAGIEWWYFTAYVHGSDGHRYSVFFTLFKRGSFVLPVSQVVNLDTGSIALHGRLSGLCQPTYVLDIPAGHGKSPIGPTYVTRDLSRNGARCYLIEDFKGARHVYPPKARQPRRSKVAQSKD